MLPFVCRVDVVRAGSSSICVGNRHGSSSHPRSGNTPRHRRLGKVGGKRAREENIVDIYGVV